MGVRAGKTQQASKRFFFETMFENSIVSGHCASLATRCDFKPTCLPGKDACTDSDGVFAPAGGQQQCTFENAPAVNCSFPTELAHIMAQLPFRLT